MRLSDAELDELEQRARSANAIGRELVGVAGGGRVAASADAILSLVKEVRSSRAALAALANVARRAAALESDDRFTQVPTLEWEQATQLARAAMK